MKTPQTETTDTQQWFGPEWKIMPYLYPEVTIESPTPFIKLQDWKPHDEVVPGGEFRLSPSEERDEDAEDFFDARATEFKYQTEGIKGFRSYREYRGRKLRQNR